MANVSSVTVGFPINNSSLVEGNTGTKKYPFTVELSAASTLPVTVSYTTDKLIGGSAQAGSDFVATTGKVTFAPGETSKTISVDIIGDTQYEANETFYIELISAEGATIVTNGAEGLRNSWIAASIVNDDIKTPAGYTTKLGYKDGTLRLVVTPEEWRSTNNTISFTAFNYPQIFDIVLVLP